ncbi:MAG: CorA family divalent cation transporter, partial [Chitinivibrionales bacterium]
VIDNYIYIMERTGEHIEDIEDELVSEAINDTVARIYHFKQRINFFRKMMRPAGEFVTQLSKLESHLIQESTHPFLKDLQDNSKQALERIETYREMLSDQLNIYNTLMNNHLSEIMKVLTIFSAVFIPLTFLAGIYGTNFDYLPELHYKYSYLIFWIIIVCMVTGMLLFFKKKRWI